MVNVQLPPALRRSKNQLKRMKMPRTRSSYLEMKMKKVLVTPSTAMSNVL